MMNDQGSLFLIVTIKRNLLALYQLLYTSSRFSPPHIPARVLALLAEDMLYNATRGCAFIHQVYERLLSVRRPIRVRQGKRYGETWHPSERPPYPLDTT